jgi:N-acetylglutamate synthase-like GNAT family acetyltransferase
MKMIFINNSSDFLKLLNSYKEYFRGTTGIKVCQFQQCLSFGEKVKVKDVISIELNDGSYIRFGQGDKPNQFEIATICVNSKNRKNGLGTYLIKLMFTFISDTIGFIPPFMLECTGMLNYNFSSVKDQSNFFRKFGFRVTSKKGYPNYIKMEIDFSKIKVSELTINDQRLAA